MATKNKNFRLQLRSRQKGFYGTCTKYKISLNFLQAIKNHCQLIISLLLTCDLDKVPF